MLVCLFAWCLTLCQQFSNAELSATHELDRSSRIAEDLRLEVVPFLVADLNAIP